MSNHDPTPESGGSLFGSLFLFIVLLFFIGAVLNQDERHTAVAIINTATPETNALATLLPTPTIADHLYPSRKAHFKTPVL